MRIRSFALDFKQVSLGSQLKSQRGVTLIEMMIATGLISVLALSIGTMISKASQAQARANFVATLSNLRSQYTAILQNSSAWTQTVRANSPTMDCIKNKTSCSAASQKTQSFVLYGADGTAIYNPNDPAIGFAADGSICHAYGSSKTCALHMDLNWQAICLAGDAGCTTPEIQVNGVFYYNGPDYGSLKENYNISILNFSGVAVTMQQVCTSLDGTYDATANTCKPKSTCTASDLASTRSSANGSDGGGGANSGAGSSGGGGAGAAGGAGGGGSGGGGS